VSLCSSQRQAEEAQRRATAIMGDLGLALHPDKIRVVDLREGTEGSALVFTTEPGPSGISSIRGEGGPASNRLEGDLNTSHRGLDPRGGSESLVWCRLI
jgi:hypothetical protein